MSAQVICKIIPLFANLLVLKIYLPDVFGEFGVIVAWMALASSIANLSLENAILHSNGKKEIKKISISCIAVSTILSIVQILCAIVAIVIYNIDLSYLLVGAYTFLKSIYNLQTAVVIKFGHIQQITWSKFVETISFNVLMIGFGMYDPNFWSLVSASFLSVILGIWVLRRYLYLRLKNGISEIINCISINKHYPIYIASAALIDTVAANLHIIILSWLYSSQLIGELFWVQRILNVPIYMLVSINQLSIKMLTSEKQSIAQLYSKLIYFIRILLLVALLGTSFILVVKIEDFNSLIPYGWNNLLSILQIVLPGFLFTYIFKLLMPIFLYEYKHKMVLLYDLSIGIASIIALFLVVMLEANFKSSLICLTALRVVCTLAFIYIALRLLKSRVA
jgi:O-antigen/teichoic acid export membrane protein